jgi:hypothetical protein
MRVELKNVDVNQQPVQETARDAVGNRQRIDRPCLFMAVRPEGADH